MSRIAKTWKPILRRFYLRTHPDLLNKFPEEQKENEESFKRLESMLVKRPKEQVHLKFHVLEKGKRESIEFAVETSIRPARTRQDWEDSVAAGLTNLVSEVFADTDEADGKLIAEMKQKQREKELEKGKAIMKNRLREFENAMRSTNGRKGGHGLREEIDQVDAEEDLFQISEEELALHFASSTLWNSDWNHLPILQIAESMFHENRFQASDQVDEHTAVQVLVQVLNTLPRETLSHLGSDMLKDLVFVLRFTETQVQGRVVSLNAESNITELALDIERVVDHLKKIHLRIRGGMFPDPL